MSARPVPPPGLGTTSPADLPPMEMGGRVTLARELAAKAGCAALLVSKLANVRYLSGFSGSAGMLLVRPDDAVLVTDRRYASQAPAEVARSRAPVEVRACLAVDQPALLAELTAGFATVALEAEDLSWAAQRRLRAQWDQSTELVPTELLVEKLRERKDGAELARTAAAAAVAGQAFDLVLPMLGRRPTEVEVAAALDAEMRRLGAEAPAFETIIAGGTCAVEPHHRPCRRRIQVGELVVMDFGARVDGYCSDMTRTVWAGPPGGLPPELRRLAAVVLASQDAGLSAVREGARARDVDRACREVVEAEGWGDWYVHGTGHGVGLEIHEAPAISPSSEDILLSGQVVTVEPGVYIPGVGGARTEDTVVVAEAGCELLTLTPKMTPITDGR